MHQTNHRNLVQNIGLKEMMTHVESISPLVKLNLKLQC